MDAIPPPPDLPDEDPRIRRAWISARRDGPIDESFQQPLSEHDLEAPIPEEELSSPAAIHADTEDRLPTIDGYIVEREIGRGGQAVVYAGRREQPAQAVALKVWDQGAGFRSRLRRRIELEVQALERVSHANVVKVLDFAHTTDGNIFLAMPLIDGRRLDVVAAELREDPTHPLPILKIFDRILRALEAVHAAGIIHRDLKPSNILVDQWGEPHLLDFGLARELPDCKSDLSLTATGELVGSLAWISPEQASGQGKLDHRSDIYSLGVVLYHALTGERPYGSDHDLPAMLDAIARFEPRAPLAGKTGKDSVRRASVNAVVLRALMKRPNDRWENAASMRRALESAIAGSRIPAPPSRRRLRRLLLTTAAVIAALSTSAVVIYRFATDPDRQRIVPLNIPKEEGLHGMELRYIPGGTYFRGSPPGEDGRSQDEGRERVTVGPVWISATEVTRGMYRRVMERSESTATTREDNLPMVAITFSQAEDFCARLSELTGQRYRLPTENEWEWACRAGADGAFAGTKSMGSMGWCAENSSAPQAVALKSPNPWGLYDCHGNVREWTSTRKPGTEGFPANEPPRCVRGGSYAQPANRCRAATRDYVLPDSSLPDLGFRVVREAIRSEP